MEPNGEWSQLCDPTQAPIVGSNSLQVVQILFKCSTLANRIGDT